MTKDIPMGVTGNPCGDWMDDGDWRDIQARAFDSRRAERVDPIPAGAMPVAVVHRAVSATGEHASPFGRMRWLLGWTGLAPVDHTDARQFAELRAEAA